MAFRDELTAEGKVNAAEIERIYISYAVSDKHLKFITTFLSCKIGIYENGILKKYGNWENQNNIDVLTLILSFENGLYSVVLNL
uniref:Uncharacterized protein n=1 Tax=Panagrolaimus sp. PS1159 TaxID=55785 RepID=A0AC35GHB2_9BILA